MKVNQKGGAAVEIVLLVVLVALIGFVGWRVMEANRAKPTTTTTSTAAEETIQTVADLKQAGKDLENTDLDKELDTSEFDTVLQ